VTPAGRAALAALATVVAACTASYDRSPAWPPLAIGVRLADVTPGATPTRVYLGDESRLVLSASREIELPPGFWGVDTDHPGQVFYRIKLPPELELAPRVVIQVESIEPARHVTFKPYLVKPADGTLVSVPAPRAATRGKVLGVRATARVVPDLATRDLVTEPIAIPAGATLSTAIGVEPAMWIMQVSPLTFQVTAIDGEGHETVVKETRLDPFGWPLHRRWIEWRIDLGALAGRTVRLRFAVSAKADDASLPVWADPTILVPRTSPAPAYDVLLVSLDTLRARSVSAYGAERPTTPSFDAFADDGVLFGDASTAAPHTLTSHLSVFTGSYMRAALLEPLSVLRADVPTLPERLRRAGYDTAAFTEDAFVAPAFGFARGFATYGEDKSADFHEPEGHVERTFEHGVTWLRDHHDRPFFLFLHTYQVHFPYDPPPAYASELAEPELYPEGPEHDRLLYEQEARYTDDALAALLGELDALGLRERTLVVVFGDHGEEFYEHGEHFHGSDLYDEVIRVPLAMRLPGLVPAGRRVAEPVSLVDVLPTILDALGLPAPAGIDGRSLLPLALGATPAARVVFSAPGTGFNAFAAVRTADYTCVWKRKPPLSECFDRRRDPFERHPLRGEPPAGVGEARRALADFQARDPDPGTSTLEHPVPPDVDPERLEKLRALGYVE
jgi:arylsulfatase A-like enzyme